VLEYYHFKCVVSECGASGWGKVITEHLKDLMAFSSLRRMTWSVDYPL